MKKIFVAALIIMNSTLAMAGEKLDGDALLIQNLVNATPDHKKDLEKITGKLTMGADHKQLYQLKGADIKKGTVTIETVYTFEKYRDKPAPIVAAGAPEPEGYDPELGKYVIRIKGKTIDEILPQTAAADDVEDYILPSGLIKRIGDFYFSENDEGVIVEWNLHKPSYLTQISADDQQKIIDSLKIIWKAGLNTQSIEENFGILNINRDGPRGERETESRIWKLLVNEDPEAEERFYLYFETPLPSKEILPLFGLRNPEIRADDVYSDPVLVDAKTGEPPKFKDLKVVVLFENTGLEEIKDKSAAPAVRFKTENARIRSITIERPQLNVKPLTGSGAGQ